MQNIQPLGINTRFLPLLVLRLIVRPSCPKTLVSNGKDTSNPSFLFFALSLNVGFTVDKAAIKIVASIYITLEQNLMQIFDIDQATFMSTEDACCLGRWVGRGRRGLQVLSLPPLKTTSSAGRFQKLKATWG